MDQKKRTLLAELALLVLAMIWGGTFVASALALRAFDPFWIMVFRFLIGSAIVLALRPRDCLNLDAYTIRAGIEVGLLLGIGVAFQLVGLKYTTPGQQSFIIVTYVITVPLMQWFVDKVYPGHLTLVAGVLALAGVGFLTLNEGFSVNFGDLLTMIYVLFFAVQMIRVGAHAPHVNSPFGFTFIQLITAGLASLVLALVLGQSFIIARPGFSAWAGLAYLTVLNTAVAYLLQNFGQKYARPSTAAIILSLEALFGAVAAHFITGEVFTIQKILGCSLIFAAVILTQVVGRFLNKSKSRA